MAESNQNIDRPNPTPIQPSDSTEQIPLEPPVEKPKPKIKLPIIIVLFVIFLLIAGGAAAYLFILKPTPPEKIITEKMSPPTSTPTPDPTADWKTYENSEENYSFKYPPSLSIEKSHGNIILDVSNNEISIMSEPTL